MSKKLQLQSDLTLEKAIQKARQSEMIKSQVTDQSSLAASNLQKVQRKRKSVYSRSRNAHGKGKRDASFQQQSQKKCSRCGLHYMKPEHCPAKDKKYLKCHFAAVCCSKSVNVVRSDSDGATERSQADHWFLGALSDDSHQDDKRKVQLKVSGRPVTFQIHTGADISAISKSTFNNLPHQPKLHPSKIALFSPGGELQCTGQFTTNVTHRNKSYEVDIFVISGEHESNFLGRKKACEMGLVARLEDGDAEVFGDIGLFNCEPVKI